MLINQYGIESDDEITRLDDHRTVRDPKNRETMTSLLQESMRPVKRSELLSAPLRTDAPVLVLDTTEPAAANDESSRTDVA